MTAQSSANKAVFHNFRPYYLNKLRMLRPQFIMSCILALLSYPAAGAVLYPLCSGAREWNRLVQIGAPEIQRQELADRVSGITQTFIGIAVIGGICLVALFVFTFISTLRSFRYLYDKTYVDMDMSLPVSHNTRYFGDLAAVFTTSILPHLAAILIGIVMLYTCGLDSASNGDYSFDTIYRVVVQCMFTGLYSCIMQIGLSLLILSVCGRKAEAFIYPVLVNIAIPVIHMLAQSLIASGVYGANDNNISLFSGVTEYFGVSYTSPLGMLLMTFLSVAVVSGYFADGSELMNMPMFRAQLFIPALILTIVFFAAAYFLIKKRRSERVGMPYVFKVIDLIIPGVLIFALSLPFCGMIFSSLLNRDKDTLFSFSINITSVVIWLVVLTFIGYIIMNLISGRNFRRFHITLAKWAGTLAVCVGISALLAFSRGFGAADYVPDPDSVVMVELDLAKDDHGVDQLDYVNVSSRSREQIEAAVEVHRLVPKKGPSDGRNYVSVSYTLSSGEYVSRSYWVSDDVFEQIMNTVVTPERWYLIKYDHTLLTNPGNKKITSVYYNDVTYKNAGITPEELITAVKSDFAGISYDSLKGVEGLDSYNLEIRTADPAHQDNTTSDYIIVYSWMENTLELFRQHGIDIVGESFRNTCSIAFIEKVDSGEHEFAGNPLEFMLAAKEGISIEELKSEYSDHYTFNDDSLSYTFGCPDRNDERFKKLMAAASMYYVEGSYRIEVTDFSSVDEYFGDMAGDSRMYYIPAKYDDLAEELLNDCVLASVDTVEAEIA